MEEPAFDLARSYGIYTGALRQAILRLKFGRHAQLGKKLGGLLGSAWEMLPVEDTGAEWLIVPVPLHPSRRRERGFNQAELLARGLVRELQREGKSRELRVGADCLRRSRATKPQTGLSLAARRENVRGVFTVDRPQEVEERAVLLIDDVMTTGATLSACARALKRAGAARVLALTVARATPQFPDLETADGQFMVDGVGREWT